MNDSVRVIAFADRQGRTVFVKVPGEYGRYVRTSVAVTVSPCHCGAAVGEPCVGQYGRRTGSVHADRLVAADKLFREMGVRQRDVSHEDVVEEETPPAEKKERDDVIDLREFFK
jgi:hypothetical protein